MGGSGGSFFETKDPSDLIRKVREAERKTESEAFETGVADMIGRLLTEVNERDAEAVQTHIKEIKAALEKEIEGTVDLAFGGSVAKHTYVNGLSDIDALVFLNDSGMDGISPDQAKQYFADRLSAHFPYTKLTVGRLAVTLSFQDIDVQLLPALKGASGVRISSEDGSRWSLVHPDVFAEKLTQWNQALGRKLVPIIKLAKSIIAELPEKRQLTGYHVEALAIEVFKNYDGPKTPKTMLETFFVEGPRLLLTPIADKTGQSIHVDDYFGQAGSLQRQIAADTLGRIGRRMKNANGAQSVSQWAELLGVDPQ